MNNEYFGLECYDYAVDLGNEKTLIKLITFLLTCVDNLYSRRTSAGFSKLRMGCSSGSPVYFTSNLRRPFII